MTKQHTTDSDGKAYWYVYRKSDLRIVGGAFERIEEANDAIMDIDADGQDSDGFDVGLGFNVKRHFTAL